MGENDNGEEIKDQANKGADNQDDKSKDGGADDKGAAADDKDGKGDDKSKDGVGDGEADDKSNKPAPNADDEPQSRKRNIDFIQERKNRKAEKDAAKNNANDDDDIDDEDSEIIGKVVSKYISPIIAKQMQEEDKQEIDAFVSANPDFKPYADKVAKYAQHASRKNMPIKAIFYEVAGPDLLKIGADRAKKANDEAKESKGAGGDGEAETKKSVWDLTPDEFAAEQQKIREKNR